MKGSVIFLGLFFLARLTADVRAQAIPQTWVASGGTDLNPCTRIAPCATFSGAAAKTQAGGEIDVVDAGSYGPIDIRSGSLTIDGGSLATISVPTGGAGITINVGDNDLVVIRNLEINGNGVGARGVSIGKGGQVILDNLRILNVQAAGVAIDLGLRGTTARNLVISNSTISAGINAHGVLANQGVVTVSHSTIAGNGGVGLFAINLGVINAVDDVLTRNGVALQAGSGGANQGAATVRLSDNAVYGNLTGFGCGGGLLFSSGDNRKGNNSGGANPACAPNGPITQQ
jgi:hypothetical protein